MTRYALLRTRSGRSSTGGRPQGRPTPRRVNSCHRAGAAAGAPAAGPADPVARRGHVCDRPGRPLATGVAGCPGRGRPGVGARHRPVPRRERLHGRAPVRARLPGRDRRASRSPAALVRCLRGPGALAPRAVPARADPGRCRGPGPELAAAAARRRASLAGGPHRDGAPADDRGRSPFRCGRRHQGRLLCGRRRDNGASRRHLLAGSRGRGALRGDRRGPERVRSRPGGDQAAQAGDRH